jgi:ribosomal protein S18 acetylase RimI-like enzyme
VTTICRPGAQEHKEWQRLYEAYAAFYQMPMSSQILDTVWSWINDENNPFYCLMAKDDHGKAIGLMHYRAMPSPIRGKIVGFLDDLFVEPAYRGTGVVEALYAQLREESRRLGWPFVRWITRENNYRGRAVYDRIATRTDWVTYQFDTEAKA